MASNAYYKRQGTLTAPLRKVSTPQGSSAQRRYSRKLAAQVYLKNILLFALPGFFLFHLPMIALKMILTHLGHDAEMAAMPDFLVLVYGVMMVFAYLRAQKHLAFYRVMETYRQSTINRQHEARGIRSIQGQEQFDKERLHLNKYLLFPSRAEMRMLDYLVAREDRKGIAGAEVNAHALRDALSLENRKAEHAAARAAANAKQERVGGPNEYEALVRKYRFRTTAAVRRLIKRRLH